MTRNGSRGFREFIIEWTKYPTKLPQLRRSDYVQTTIHFYDGSPRVGLILGAFTRIAAFGVLCNMLVAAMMVHLPNGFFMNWGGNQKGEGFEFHLLAIGILLVLVVRGGGAFSVDGALARPDRRFV